MRKLTIAAMLLFSVGAMAQPAFYQANRITALRQFYLGTSRVDSISQDTMFAYPTAFKLPSCFAVSRYVKNAILNNTISSLPWANVTGKPTANGTTSGILSSSDWNGFNGKQTALNGTGLVRMSGTTVSYDNNSYLTTSTGRTAISLTNTGTGAASYNSITGVINLPTPALLATASGDATGSVSATNLPLTLATVNSNVGSFGSGQRATKITVNAKGLVTAASDTVIQIAQSQVTNLVADLAAKQATINGTGFIKATGTTISYDNSSYLQGSGLNTNSLVYVGGSGVTSYSFIRLNPSLYYLALGNASPLSSLHCNSANPTFLGHTTSVVTPFSSTALGAWQDIYFTNRFGVFSTSTGGALMSGFSSSASTNGTTIQGHVGSASPAVAANLIQGFKSDGSTGRTAMAGSEIVLGVGSSYQILANGKTTVTTGTNAPVDKATLSGGTVTVNTTAVTANSVIFLTVQPTGTFNGRIRVSAIVASTSFTITSSDAADNCSVAYQIIN